jgi:hypothetical protein
MALCRFLLADRGGGQWPEALRPLASIAIQLLFGDPLRSWPTTRLHALIWMALTPRVLHSCPDPQSAVDRLRPTASAAQSSLVRSRSRKILAGKFGWGTNEPLLKAGVGLMGPTDPVWTADMTDSGAD